MQSPSAAAVLSKTYLNFHLPSLLPDTLHQHAETNPLHHPALSQVLAPHQYFHSNYANGARNPRSKRISQALYQSLVLYQPLSVQAAVLVYSYFLCLHLYLILVSER